ncbi:MAG TPA: trypsin-like peptidase domain-containing protein [Chloroflexota bacterium]|jgi:serine protease Do
MKEMLGAAAVEVAEQVWASVVQVSTNGHGAGAGTIWRSDGVVVTNHHVAPGETATVTLADTRSYPARAIARDPANDLAVLKIDARDLPAVTVGDPRALRPGEIVLAVGHPFGVKNAVTVGLVTEALRRGERGRELIQADVLLGPGNSGGPLANARGQVVGINAMVAGGLGLAVPSYLVAPLLVPQEERPVLGVRVQAAELTPAMAARLGVAAGPALVVAAVGDGSPAERAGVQLGDVLLALGGERLRGPDDLVGALAGSLAGPIRLSLLRGGRPLEVIVLPERPASRAA